MRLEPGTTLGSNIINVMAVERQVLCRIFTPQERREALNIEYM